MDTKKISIIQKVPPPQKIRDVQSFLGLARYYRRFIKDFSKIASPLFGLLGKVAEFIWTDNCQEALDTLKSKLVTTRKEKNDTLELVNLSQGKEVIGVKWVYKTKRNVEGKIERHKVRLVVKGYKQ